MTTFDAVGAIVLWGRGKSAVRYIKILLLNRRLYQLFFVHRRSESRVLGFKCTTMRTMRYLIISIEGKTSVVISNHLTPFSLGSRL